MSFDYPVFLDLKERPVLVVGGGKVALRKTLTLIDAGAKVRVITKEACEGMTDLCEEGRADLELRSYCEDDEKGFLLVFAATGDHEVNSLIAKSCKENGVLLNAVDDPSNCDLIIPAQLERGDVKIAVSTNGRSPMLAAMIRDEIGKTVTDEYAEAARILGEVRDRVNASSLTEEERKKMYGELLDGDLIAELKNGNDAAVRERVDQWISSWLV